MLQVEATVGLAAPRLGLATPAAIPLAIPPGQRLDRPALGTGARLTADLRVPTDLGPLRVFVSLRGHNGAAAERGAR